MTGAPQPLAPPAFDLAEAGWRRAWLDHARAHRAVLDVAAEAVAGSVAAAARLLVDCLDAGGTAFFCGNGGSAADAQHLATELSVRFRQTRPAMRAMALPMDAPSLTACGNDFGFRDVFARQIEAVARRDDVLVAISTSGRSENVLRGLERARELGLRTILMTGAGCPCDPDVADVFVAIPSTDTAHIQELHITVGHALCGIVEGGLRHDRKS